MGHHLTDIAPAARIVGLRVKRSNSDVWEDYSHLAGPSPSLPGGSDTMRVKCLVCSEVNSISAHVEDEQEVSWGCSGCGAFQVIVPATLEQRTFATDDTAAPEPEPPSDPSEV